MIKLSPVQKIAFSGILTALVIIFTRFLSIQNIPAIPFVRISIGPALIMFSSLALGPVYGGIIGGLSDILGILLVPNSLGYAINPLFTLVYALFGVCPYFVYKLIIKVKSKKILVTSFIISTAVIYVVSCLFIFVFCPDSAFIFNNDPGTVWPVKFIFFGILTLVYALALFVIFFLPKHLKNKNDNEDIFTLGITSISVEFVVFVILNSIFKTIFFEVNFLYIFIASTIVMFIDLILNTFICRYLNRLMSKIAKRG